MTPDLSRPKQTNCQNEPCYPGMETVVFVLSCPDMTAHAPTPFCPHEYPHPTETCWMWTGGIEVAR